MAAAVVRFQAPRLGRQTEGESVFIKTDIVPGLQTWGKWSRVIAL
jgi:hypothetical protein